VNNVQLDTSPRGILLIVAVVLFLLAAFSVDLGTIALVPLGLAAMALAALLSR
jgi:hypothetical protein